MSVLRVRPWLGSPWAQGHVLCREKPSLKSTRCYQRAFSNAAPKAWNTPLPSSLFSWEAHQCYCQVRGWSHAVSHTGSPSALGMGGCSSSAMRHLWANGIGAKGTHQLAGREWLPAAIRGQMVPLELQLLVCPKLRRPTTSKVCWERILVKSELKAAFRALCCSRRTRPAGPSCSSCLTCLPQARAFPH